MDDLSSISALAAEAQVTFREVYDNAPALLPFELPPTLAQGVETASAVLEALPIDLQLPSVAQIQSGANQILGDLLDDARPVVETVDQLFDDALATIAQIEDAIQVVTESGNQVLQSLEWLF